MHPRVSSIRNDVLQISEKYNNHIRRKYKKGNIYDIIK